MISPSLETSNGNGEKEIQQREKQREGLKEGDRNGSCEGR
jgi:hypothetical protein